MSSYVLKNNRVLQYLTRKYKSLHRNVIKKKVIKLHKNSKTL